MRLPVLDKRERSPQDMNFFMYEYKTRRCEVRRTHEWKNCCSVHEGEKARRRNPVIHCYSPDPCLEFMKRGSCPKADACPLAHGVWESWLHPHKFCTVLCSDGVNCKRKVCWFAHTPQELRSPCTPAAGAPTAAPPAAATQVPNSSSSSRILGGAMFRELAGCPAGSTPAAAAAAAAASSTASDPNSSSSRSSSAASSLLSGAISSAASMNDSCSGSILFPIANAPLSPALTEQLQSLQQGTVQLPVSMSLAPAPPALLASPLLPRAPVVLLPAAAAAVPGGRPSTGPSAVGAANLQLRLQMQGLHNHQQHQQLCQQQQQQLQLQLQELQNHQQQHLQMQLLQSQQQPLQQPLPLPVLPTLQQQHLQLQGPGLVGASAALPPLPTPTWLPDVTTAVPVNVLPMLSTTAAAGAQPLSLVDSMLPPAMLAIAGANSSDGGGGSSSPSTVAGLLSSLQEDALRAHRQAASAEAAAAAADTKLQAVLSALEGMCMSASPAAPH